MFRIDFFILQQLLTYLVGIHIAALIIFNKISNDEFSIFTLILAPIISGIAIFSGLHLLDHLDIEQELHWSFLLLCSFLVYGLVFFFVMGFDSNRHASNVVGLGFFSVVFSLLLYAALHQLGYLDLTTLFKNN